MSFNVIKRWFGFYLKIFISKIFQKDPPRHLKSWFPYFPSAYSIFFTLPFSTLPTSPSSPSLVPMSLMCFTKGYSIASESPCAPLLLWLPVIIKIDISLLPCIPPGFWKFAESFDHLLHHLGAVSKRRTQIKAFPNGFRRWCSPEHRCRTKNLLVDQIELPALSRTKGYLRHWLADFRRKKKDSPKSTIISSSLSHWGSMLDMTTGSISSSGADESISCPDMVTILYSIGRPNLRIISRSDHASISAGIWMRIFDDVYIVCKVHQLCKCTMQKAIIPAWTTPFECKNCKRLSGLSSQPANQSPSKSMALTLMTTCLSNAWSTNFRYVPSKDEPHWGPQSRSKRG